MRGKSGALWRVGLALTLALAPVLSWSQVFPSKPIKVIVGFAAGGPLDVFTRVLAQELTTQLGQAVVVENRAGASGQIATNVVAQAEPDGYTLMSTASTFIVNPILTGRPSPAPLKDFVPVAQTAVLPTVLVTAPDLPVQSLQDLVRLARTRPLTYSSAGNGGPGHLAGALLAHTTGTQMTHVPYRGAAPALADVMAGRIDFTFYTMSGLKEQVAAGKVKPLAITSARRHPDFPDVPTMTEAGVAGFDQVGAWFGIVAPANTPAPVIARLNQAIDRSLAHAETREKITRMGIVPVGGSSESFRSFLIGDSARWSALIKAADIKAE